MSTTKKSKISIFKIIIATVLILYALSIAFVIGWGFLTSLKCTMDFSDKRNYFGLPNLTDWPTLTTKEVAKDALLFGNYAYIWKNFTYTVEANSYYSKSGVIEVGAYDTNIISLLFNSFIFAGVGCFLQALCQMTMGYMCAKYKFKMSSIIYTTIVVMMSLPIVGSQPAEIALLKDLGLYNSYLCMIIHKFCFGGIHFLLFYAFFSNMSNGYTEAAEIDGASQLRIYLHIIIPLSMKMVGTIFLLLFINAWNDYQTPLVYYPSFPTFAYGVFRMSTVTGGTVNTQGTPQRFAGCMILALPALVIFVCFKNILMGSLTTGGLKE
ncbi:MAG: carbohydrate ABC transporter permease [Clostridia bacterium]|nr:carbohydrate ABC transporter permease [Clostridia bacterium]